MSKPHCGRYCIVKGCKSKSSDRVNGIPISLYNFPTENMAHRRERRKVWVDAVIKHCKLDPNWQPSKTHQICSRHFVGGSKSEHPFHPGYNPTLFPGQYSEKAEKKGKAHLARFQRYIKRNPVKLSIDSKKKERENVPFKTTEQVQSINCSTSNDVVKRITEYSDFTCQVNLMGDIDSNTVRNLIICNRIVENSSNFAETQILQMF